MPAYFFETVVFDAASRVGVQVLAAPPQVDGQPIDYTRVFEEFARGESTYPEFARLEDDRLVAAIAAVADAAYAWQPGGHGVWAAVGREAPEARTDALAFAERLVFDDLIVVEQSPVSKANIVTLMGMAAFGGLFVVGGVPLLALVGGEIGIVVVRGATKVAGALWKGAEPEVEDFGRDLAADVLDAVRTRLGIRHQPPDD